MSGAPLVREMGDADIAAALALWRTEPDVGIGIGDDAHGLARLLARNPHLSHVALAGTELVATCLAGHDGRRGTLYHVAVAPAWRRQGLARRLVAASLANLERLGIGKCGLLVFAGNHEAQGFWRATRATRCTSGSSTSRPRRGAAGSAAPSSPACAPRPGQGAPCASSAWSATSGAWRSGAGSASTTTA
jgi:ribosomal protein S18 acetylase RimI-like enzyme